MKEAMYYEKLDDLKVGCKLCPHNCLLGTGKTGICGVRRNTDGKLYSRIYGKTSSTHPDPIEKKPLYHFIPGSKAMSFGTIGCNFKCDFCQNSGISQADVERSSLMKITPEETVRMAKRAGCASIAWTYNEPTIWYEFTYDSSKLAHEEGIKNIYVTNGFINPEPLRNISPYLDAMNIDVKSFSDDFYRKIAGGRLQKVLDTCKLASELNIHIELTYLVIPKLNDDPGEIEKYLQWVLRELGPDIPLHFSAFHPDFKMTDRKRTSTSSLVDIYERAMEMGMHYVFLGNVLADRGAHTHCPGCGKWVIKRSYMGLRKNRLKDGKCPKCKTAIKVILS